MRKHQIHLELQLDAGEEDRHILAYVKDTQGKLFFEAPVVLKSVGDGLYRNDECEIPEGERYTAQYKVFKDAEFATLDEDYPIRFDVFHIRGGRQIPNTKMNEKHAEDCICSNCVDAGIGYV